MGRLPFDLDIEDISALADIMNKKKLGEIRMVDKDIGVKLVIKGQSACPPPPPAPAAPPQIMVIPGAAPAPAAAPVPEPQQTAEISRLEKDKMIEGTTVKSPIVGTYYSSSSPGKPPFVKVGQKVRKGDIIMIIESMKIMNEIPSPCDGTVLKIFAENGEAVEYDQPVMLIG